jgi:glycogen phosphorylase
VRAQPAGAHTPVEAGYDRFAYDDAARLLSDFIETDQLKLLAGQDRLNMTRLALNLSNYVNGVTIRHAETARQMFPGYSIRAVTNGRARPDLDAPSLWPPLSGHCAGLGPRSGGVGRGGPAAR